MKTTLSYSIRKLRADDVKALSDLIENVARKFLFHEFTDSGQDNFLKSVTGQGIVKNINEGFKYWVAEYNSSIIGVIAFKNTSHLYNLFIDEKHHRKGVASMLWNESTKNKLVANYTVFSSSYAVPVYEKFGFVKTGEPTSMEGIYCIPMEKVN